MARQTPIGIPQSLIAGDTWAWDQPPYADFPLADNWVLSYAFSRRDSDSRFTLTASNDGSNHTIRSAKAATAGREPGQYRWAAWVDDGMSRYQVAEGWIEIKPDPAEATTSDFYQTHDEKVLLATRAAIETRMAGDIPESYSVGNRNLQKMSIAELRTMERLYAARVARARHPGRFGTPVEIWA